MNLVNVSNVTNGAQIERLFLIEILKKRKCNNLEPKSIWTIIYLWQKYNFGVTVNLVTTLSNSQFGLCYSHITVNFQTIFVSKLTIRTKLTTSWKNNMN